MDLKVLGKAVLLFCIWWQTEASLQRDYKLVDMTHPISKESPIWGEHSHYKLIEGPKVTFVNNATKHKFWFTYNTIEIPEHIGTHIDTPAHFVNGSHKVHEIDTMKLWGDAVYMDFTLQASKNPNYQISRKDIEDWQSAHFKIPKSTIVVFGFNWFKKWPDAKTFFGTDTPNAFITYKHPGLHPDAATYLRVNLTVKAVATDSPALDYGQTKDFRSHKILNENNIPIIAAVTNTDQLPTNKTFTLFALPIPIVGGTAAPARVFAMKK